MHNDNRAGTVRSYKDNSKPNGIAFVKEGEAVDGGYSEDSDRQPSNRGTIRIGGGT